MNFTLAHKLLAAVLVSVAATQAHAQISPVRNGPPPPGYQVEQQNSYAPPINDRRQGIQPPPSGRLENPISQLLTLSHKAATGIGETATFKIVYDVRASQVHLVNVNLFPYHVDFATRMLGYSKSLDVFNRNYAGPLTNREYVLGSVVLLKDQNLSLGYRGLFELWSGDSLDVQGIRTVIAAVQRSMPNQLQLKFHPLSTSQEQLAASGFSRGEYVLTVDLIGNRNFLIFNKAEAYGYLKFASTDPNVQDEFDLTTIAVYDKVPNDISLIGGVITAEPQTPLSHVNVKSMNRNTMNIYIRNARTALRQYENKPVRITLSDDRPTITVLDEASARTLISRFWSQRRPRLNGRPQFVLDPRYNNDFVQLHNFYQSLPDKRTHSQLIQKVGAKAANLGLLNVLTKRLSLPNVVSPETLGIPFNFYEQFMNQQQAGLDETNPASLSTPSAEVRKILNRYDLLNPTAIHPIAHIREGLTKVKAVYSRAQVPQTMLSVFKRYIIDDTSSPVHISKHPRLRLRSSTNSEDLDGFTGAGLYDSDGVNLYKKKADGSYDKSQPLQWSEIEKKLKKVVPALYSSVWNERAYQEREWYQMNGLQHLDIKVGLAFHSAFPLKDFNGLAENANGVAVTTNVYNTSDWGKIYLNSQHYDLSVTNPPTAEELTELGERADQTYKTEEILITSFTADDTTNSRPNNWQRWPLERLGSSSVKGGAAVFQGNEALRLAHALYKLNQQMARVYQKPSDNFPIDVEWKVYGPERTLIIKQARPLATQPH